MLSVVTLRDEKRYLDAWMECYFDTTGRVGPPDWRRFGLTLPRAERLLDQLGLIGDYVPLIQE
ncbi:MAG: hypothetical protein FJX76_28345 [Armatimonadetes bacterium]|nr:hypothetical protein [Armatimonadota bacterium]